jgi:NAD(P)-dependent dehydrogenase (short-subunit alcohol dehydrogenase family)
VQIQNLLEIADAMLYKNGMDSAFYKHKTAVVTGGGQGIGLCIAKTFLEAGANVVLAEADEQRGSKALRFLDKTNAAFIQTDVADEESVRALVRKTLDRFGRADFLVHNAAIAKNASVEELRFEDWKRVIDVDLSGAFLCAKHFCKWLKQSGGAIVHIASTRAQMSEPNTEAYTAAKCGLVALTHALSISLGPSVRVNCISPGWIDTAGFLHGSPPPWQIRPLDHACHPAGRVGRPEDIATMVLYLCGPQASFITGQNFVIDGGMTKKMSYPE